MKLAAIYNVFDGIELLKYSVKCTIGHVDLYIIVYQEVSNFGEKYNNFEEIARTFSDLGIKNTIFIKYEPSNLGGFHNETKKRQIGIDHAIKNHCTHFVALDCDELYFDFGKAKQSYLNAGKPGSVCGIYTYFKLPTLRFETKDGYFVPFIHELTPETTTGIGDYPFYVDPTRRINCKELALLDVQMQHFSWVRSDIERKCRNSSAKYNIERGTMLKDYHNPDVKDGFYVKDYDKKLIEVGNYFNIELT